MDLRARENQQSGKKRSAKKAKKKDISGQTMMQRLQPSVFSPDVALMQSEENRTYLKKLSNGESQSWGLVDSTVASAMHSHGGRRAEYNLNVTDLEGSPSKQRKSRYSLLKDK